MCWLFWYSYNLTTSAVPKLVYFAQGIILEESSWNRVQIGKRSSSKENECALSISLHISNVWVQLSGWSLWREKKVKGHQKHIDIILNGPWLSITNIMESSAKLSFPRLNCWVDGLTNGATSPSLRFTTINWQTECG